MKDDELIERLRRHRYNTWKDNLGPEPDKKLAADRIEELQRENNRLRKVKVENSDPDAGSGIWMRKE